METWKKLESMLAHPEPETIHQALKLLASLDEPELLARAWRDMHVARPMRQNYTNGWQDVELLPEQLEHRWLFGPPHTERLSDRSRRYLTTHLLLDTPPDAASAAPLRGRLRRLHLCGSLYDSGIGEVDFAALRACPKLRALRLDQLRVDRSLFDAIPTVRSLSFVDCEFDDGALEGLAAMPELETLQIVYRTEPTHVRLPQALELETLTLYQTSATPASGVQQLYAQRLLNPHWLTDWDHLPELHILHGVSEDLSAMPRRLETLHLENVRLRTLDGAPPTLRALHLRECAGASTLTPLKALRDLQIIDIENCGVADSLEPLLELPALRWCMLDSCIVHDTEKVSPELAARIQWTNPDIPF